jgi:hypothetical protein
MVRTCVQGSVEVVSLTRRKVVISAAIEPRHGDNTKEHSMDVDNADGDQDDGNQNGAVETVEEDGGVRLEEKWEEVSRQTPFMYLSLDIPPVPLFKVCPK